MPPPGEFIKPDTYSKMRWRRVQHIAGEFGVDGEMNFFRVYNQGRYGKVGFETLQFVISFC